MLKTRTITIAAVLASLGTAPAFAQGGSTGCSEFVGMGPDQRMEIVEALLMDTMGAEGSEATNAEIETMVAERCSRQPDSNVGLIMSELPLAVQDVPVDE